MCGRPNPLCTDRGLNGERWPAKATPGPAGGPHRQTVFGGSVAGRLCCCCLVVAQRPRARADGGGGGAHRHLPLCVVVGHPGGDVDGSRYAGAAGRAGAQPARAGGPGADRYGGVRQNGHAHPRCDGIAHGAAGGWRSGSGKCLVVGCRVGAAVLASGIACPGGSCWRGRWSLAGFQSGRTSRARFEC